MATFHVFTSRLAKTLNALLKDENRLSQMSTSAVNTTIEDYGWDKMVAGYEEVFSEILLRAK